MPGRGLRVLALLAPSSLAVQLLQPPADGGIADAATPALAIGWLVMVAVLAIRFVAALRRRATAAPTCWDEIDRLTPTGAATAWLGAGALFGAGVTGWASLSVVGVLGTGLVCAAVTWSAVIAGGARPWRRLALRRAIVPARASEGDELREELALDGVTVPAGMRLFATGQPLRHGALTRYVVDRGHAGATITLTAALGRAPRGEHAAPPLALWLGDVLGLTRTPIVHRAPVEFTVLPTYEVVDGARALLGAGGDADRTAPEQRLPTEGALRIRDYVPGDDTRRIHWVRSLLRDRVVVRLPDEVPDAVPTVRVVLDHALRGADGLTCRAPAELLDALVRVWLGVGKALAADGVRVVLVAAIGDAPVARPLSVRALHDGAALGARVCWQPTVPLERLLAHGGEPGRALAPAIVVSSRPRRAGAGADAIWVAVPDALWTPAELTPPPPGALRYPYPYGAADNRGSRRRRAAQGAGQRAQDRALFSQVLCWADLSQLTGAYVARPRAGRVALEVIS